ncbi:hypothetical protein EDC14_103736 [Hydrogenispora ethanolica]|jgi:hypothetical protein|uniref:Uncharacterized protein n=1 Tax=Hydrogenispora ethanolica TaxID=1082276 RepID=A0A4R1R334_HYDET|nr:hypothetical protein EDC14_103736 [Hydrogenispora ethanolica]
MLTEKVKEPIKVFAVFYEGRIRPVSFEWRNRKFSEFTIVSTWDGHEGNSRVIFFSIRSDEEFYEVCFRVRRMTWYLNRIISV